MKSMPYTLTRYLARNYILSFLGLVLALLSVVYLLDTVELLRRASKKGDVPLSTILEMGLFKLPEVGQIILPFAILFSAMLTFWLLTRRYELSVMRAAGLSVWQFIFPIMGVAFICGIIHVTVINPLGAFLLSRFEHYETQYLGSRRNLVSVFQDGFWIREKDSAAGEVILHAEKINLPAWSFHNVIGLAFDGQGKLAGRLDAEQARLSEGAWIFKNVHITQEGMESEYRDQYQLNTQLTRREIEESFADPETIPFWQIPSFINVLEATGFDTTRMKIHFYYLLSLPLMFIAMVLLAAAVSLRPPRSQYTLWLSAVGIAIGIMIFFLSSYLQALGNAQKIPAPLAAWSPAIITLLIGLSALLTLEDG